MDSESRLEGDGLTRASECPARDVRRLPGVRFGRAAEMYPFERSLIVTLW